MVEVKQKYAQIKLSIYKYRIHFSFNNQSLKLRQDLLLNFTTRSLVLSVYYYKLKCLLKMPFLTYTSALASACLEKA
ncbi:hypothetical protein T12_6522 [Trichinella patagoniensis]|uniref:Uncharacterized protein n=1 Tax=Trichinella patagoniensis TaxID=990121 RepID=A0A0V1A704_9BILA|nr:hypothetical protein T12_6522 [Trichinella patagoniensis]